MYLHVICLKLQIHIFPMYASAIYDPSGTWFISAFGINRKNQPSSDNASQMQNPNWLIPQDSYLPRCSNAYCPVSPMLRPHFPQAEGDSSTCTPYGCHLENDGRTPLVSGLGSDTDLIQQTSHTLELFLHVLRFWGFCVNY